MGPDVYTPSLRHTHNNWENTSGLDAVMRCGHYSPRSNQCRNYHSWRGSSPLIPLLETRKSLAPKSNFFPPFSEKVRSAALLELLLSAAEVSTNSQLRPNSPSFTSQAGKEKRKKLQQSPSSETLTVHAGNLNSFNKPTSISRPREDTQSFS